MTELRRRRLGEVLVDSGAITPDQLDIALTEQQSTRQPLGRTLVLLGFVTEAILRDALGEALQQASIELLNALPDPAAIDLLPLAVAERYNVLPVSYEPEGNRLLLAMTDTSDVVALDQIAAQLGGRTTIDVVLAGEGEIARARDRFYGFELSIDSILHEIEGNPANQGTGSGGEYAHPTVRLVDALIADAVKRHASDIHFEPEHGFLRIRCRIDGVLRQIRSLHARYWPAMAVRLKVLAELNIAESRAPQDGRMTLWLHGRRIDLRVSSLPTLHGENIVLRILDRQRGLVPLNTLGLAEAELTALQRMMARPEGIILITGPTGSGKTTTLYSILSALNAESVNIVTLEDPVEYPLPGIRQCAVNASARLGFADGIRAMLRQDPDILLVGEVRDTDTATMALRAAMTGHQVYATVHAHSALGAIPRLLDLGLKSEALAGNIIGVVAQRLVRRLCRRCREPYPASPAEKRLLGCEEDLTLWRPRGCPDCGHQGFRGRLAVMELLNVDGELDECIARGATVRQMTAVVRTAGAHSLADAALRRVVEGITSLDEAARVVDLTQRG